MKNRIVGCVCGALLAAEEMKDENGIRENDMNAPLEKGLRACIRFYQQGKISGDALLVEYFKCEYGGFHSPEKFDSIGAAIATGMAFEKEIAFDKMYSLCKIPEKENPDDSMAYAMLSGVLSGIARGEEFKRTVNWAIGRLFDAGGHEELAEFIKLVIALYESRKDLDRIVDFLKEDNQFFKAYGIALVVALKEIEDTRTQAEYEYCHAAAGKYASISIGAMIGAFEGIERIMPKLDMDCDYILHKIEMAEDLYNIAFNDAILPFDKYVPTLN